MYFNNILREVPDHPNVTDINLVKRNCYSPTDAVIIITKM